MPKARLILKTSPNEFSSRIKFLAADKINKRLVKVKPNIEKRVTKIVQQEVINSPEVVSLKTGDMPGTLKVDFGLTDSQVNSALSQIVESIANSILVFFEKGSPRSKTLGKLVVKIDPQKIVSTVSSISGGSYQSNFSTIDWLDWLLNRGSQVIIQGFEVKQTDYDQKSRSGSGFMIPTGGAWRISPQFAGVSNNNFITRSLDRANSKIEKAIREEFRRVL